MVKKQKLLVALTGPVGSGKTYIARILAKKLGAVHVRTDDLRVTLRKQGKSLSSARRLARKETETALSKGKKVVADFDAVLPKTQKILK